MLANQHSDTSQKGHQVADKPIVSTQVIIFREAYQT
jgi:hypothetical protein